MQWEKLQLPAATGSWSFLSAVTKLELGNEETKLELGNEESWSLVTRKTRESLVNNHNIVGVGLSKNFDSSRV
jgi:hypothetical protein